MHFDLAVQVSSSMEILAVQETNHRPLLMIQRAFRRVWSVIGHWPSVRAPGIPDVTASACRHRGTNGWALPARALPLLQTRSDCSILPARTLWAILPVIILALWQAPSAIAAEADLIITGARIYTMDAARSWADALAIKNGRFLYVGDVGGCNKFKGAKTRIWTLKPDQMVLPGFHDCHVHLAESGLQMRQCDITACKTVEVIIQTIKKYAETHTSEKWIIGSGWSLPLFPNTAPTAALLDTAVSDRPALIESQDGHSSWANSLALKAAGITRNTPDPPRGRIERDDSGEPIGTLRESAVELCEKLVPPPSFDERLAGARLAVKLANSFGLTSAQDANASEAILRTYREMDRKGELTLRLVAAQQTNADAKSLPSEVERLVRLRKKYSGGRLRASSAKIFADGVIEARTAALLKPYEGSNGGTGILNVPQDRFNQFARLLEAAGFQIHTHAIGDRAIRVTLNAYENVKKNNRGMLNGRHQIAHLQLIDPEDISRFRRIGVVANFEPYWAFSDDYVVKSTIPVIGAERTSRNYPIKSVFNSGAVVTAGSDWSVTTLNPLDAIQVAVTRQSLDGKTDPFNVQERSSLPEILQAYTINGAYVNGQEKETGSIEVGKFADLVVLDRNLFDIAPVTIHDAKVDATVIEGKVVYRRK